MHFFLILTTLVVTGVVSAQPVVDGNISDAEYGTAANGNWRVSYTSTHLYVGIVNSNRDEPAIMYIDCDPEDVFLSSGFGGGMGTTTTFEYDGFSGQLPFLTDVVLYVKEGYREYRRADSGGGEWPVASSVNFGTYASNDVNRREFSVPWADICGGTPAQGINFIGFVRYSNELGAGTYSVTPSNNIAGAGQTNTAFERYHKVLDVSVTPVLSNSATSPFSKESYNFLGTSDVVNFGAIDVYDFHVVGNPNSITRGIGNWIIRRNFHVLQGIVDFGSHSNTTTIDGDVILFAGTLNLGTSPTSSVQVGGGLSVLDFGFGGQHLIMNTSGGMTVQGEYGFVPSLDVVTGTAPLRLRVSRNHVATGRSGWRMLGSPSTTTPQALSAANLVQGLSGQPGVAGGGAANMLRLSPTAFFFGFNRLGWTETIPTGRGFMWFFWANGQQGGAASFGWKDMATSPLTALGAINYGPHYDITPEVHGNPRTGGTRLYLISNPFIHNLELKAGSIQIHSGGGTLSTTLWVWDPTLSFWGGYRALTLSDASSDVLATWQGAFVQVTGPSAAPTFRVDRSFAHEGVGGTFYGKGIAGRATLDFELEGTIGATSVGDHSVRVVFTEDASHGFDQHEFVKLPTMNSVYASIAPMGPAYESDEYIPFSVRSLPLNLDRPVTIPLQFHATGAGSFALAWKDVDTLPDAWRLILTDRETGDAINLRDVERFAFTADGGTYDRFSLAIDPNGTATSTESVELPTGFTLSAPAPNPFSFGTSLDLRVMVAQRITASVYDVLGREVVQVFTGDVAPGQVQHLRVSGDGLNAGVYFLRVEGESFTETRRLVRVQ